MCPPGPAMCCWQLWIATIPQAMRTPRSSPFPGKRVGPGCRREGLVPTLDLPPPAPDDKRLYLLLRQIGLDEEAAYTFVQEIQNMASANLIARFESKLDAMDSKLGAMRSELGVQRWLMGLGFAALVAAAIAQLFRSGG